MSIQQNSWKTIQFDAVAATVKRIDLEKVFYDNNFVRPNFIQLKNLNSSDIMYVGDDNAVSSTNYRLSINPLATGKSINIDGYSNIFILIASNTNKLDLNYAYDNNPSSSDLDGTQDITVINQSLTVGNVGITSIAAGTNNIGKVVPTDGTDDLSIESDGSINTNATIQNSIPAGTNTIGKFKITDGTEDAGIDANNNLYTVLNRLSSGTGDHTLEVESDGSINTNATIQNSIPAGTNNIGKAVITGASGDVDSDGAGALKVVFVGSLTASSVKIEDSGSDELEVNADGSINVNLNAGTNNIGDVDILTIASGQNLKPATNPVNYNVTCATASTEYSQALPSNCKYFQIGIQSKDELVTWKLKFGTGGTERTYIGTESPEFNNLLLASQTIYFETDNDGEVMEIVAIS